MKEIKEKDAGQDKRYLGSRLMMLLNIKTLNSSNCCITCFLDIFVSITGTAFCMYDYRTEEEKSLHLTAQENSMKLSRSHARQIT